MDGNTYQKEARRTLPDAPDREIPAGELQMIWDVLKVTIAAGKLLEYLKKAVFHQHGVDYRLFADGLIEIAALAELRDRTPVPALTDEEVMKLWVLTGLVGESAEVGELVRDSLILHEEPPAGALRKELGDNGWYWAGLATQHNLSLNDILIGNVEKLLGPNGRYRQGYYSAEASRERE
jgi:NTP pyrophosphatase (non-canonical NTP hydrolase)